MSTENTTKLPQPEGLRSTDLLARLPHTADGRPIFLNDTVYVENPDKAWFGPDDVLTIRVHSLSTGTPFLGYQGDYSVCGEIAKGEEWEGGNLDCYAARENALRGDAELRDRSGSGTPTQE